MSANTSRPKEKEFGLGQNIVDTTPTRPTARAWNGTRAIGLRQHEVDSYRGIAKRASRHDALAGPVDIDGANRPGKQPRHDIDRVDPVKEDASVRALRVGGPADRHRPQRAEGRQLRTMSSVSGA